MRCKEGKTEIGLLRSISKAKYFYGFYNSQNITPLTISFLFALELFDADVTIFYFINTINKSKWL